MLSIMPHITNQITANVLKNLSNMKKLLVIAVLFILYGTGWLSGRWSTDRGKLDDLYIYI
jgi:hypothetical protein